MSAIIELLTFLFNNKEAVIKIKDSIKWLDTKEELKVFLDWLDDYVESCKTKEDIT